MQFRNGVFTQSGPYNGWVILIFCCVQISGGGQQAESWGVQSKNIGGEEVDYSFQLSLKVKVLLAPCDGRGPYRWLRTKRDKALGKK